MSLTAFFSFFVWLLLANVRFGRHGSPPHTFPGSLQVWSNGLRHWNETWSCLRFFLFFICYCCWFCCFYFIFYTLSDCKETLNLQCTPQCSAERLEHCLAVDRFLRDTLVEPGCIHVALKYGGLFRELFVAYCDEEKLHITHDEKTGVIHRTPVPHMSFARFFRFCLDFSVFPNLCCFEDAWHAYRNAESTLVVGSETKPIQKLKKVVSKLSTILRRGSELGGVDELLKKLATCEVEERAEPDESNNESSESEVSSSDGDSESKSSKGIAESCLRKVPVQVLPEPSAGQPSNIDRRPSIVSPKVVEEKDSKALSAIQRIRSSMLGLLEKDPSQPAAIVSALAGGKRRTQVEPLAEGAVSAPALARKVRVSSEYEVDVSRVSLSSSKEEPKEPEQFELQPRLKESADFSWIRKPFRLMSEVERKSYVLLCALGRCEVDHCNTVRSLFALAKEMGDDYGLMDHDAMSRAMKYLRVSHNFDADEFKDFAQALDCATSCEDGLVDPAELEKAVDYARQDMFRRFPEISRTKGVCIVPLGQKARCLSDAPSLELIEGTDEPLERGAFGAAAFAECLMLLGCMYMHRSGVTLKTMAPGGVKSLWLVSFLQHRFGTLLKENATALEKEAAALAEAQAALKAAASARRAYCEETKWYCEETKKPEIMTAVQQLDELEEAPRNRKAGRFNTTAPPTPPTPSKSPIRRMMNAPSLSSDDDSVLSRNGPLSPSKTAARERKRRNSMPTTPVVRTVPVVESDEPLACEALPGGFTRWVNGVGYDKSSEEKSEVESWTSQADEILGCSGRQRDKRGLGSVFCHACSCVDAKPLSTNILYPVIDPGLCLRLLSLLLLFVSFLLSCCQVVSKLSPTSLVIAMLF
ncbi:unnamed protein product [Polarella glacialis]|uniref:Uncharacterized protein n=1 Tax=Polarella glacialis TaxID=89957 RepID=A0A813LN16_POLGL|nr:unnamed protein product [Polarella glacialis]